MFRRNSEAEGLVEGMEMAAAGEMGPDLTVAEVAAALRVSRMTVYRLVYSGALGALRIGGGSVFRKRR